MPDAPVDMDEIARFIHEDLGSTDLTALIVPATTLAEASVLTRVDMVLCGGPWFEAVFALLDPTVHINWLVGEGDQVSANELICKLTGPARSLLTGERTALNILQTLSGTATLSRRYAEETEGTGLVVLDTRKTIPGLRNAQKYAVRCGGCSNHRFGLYDGILIKENHITSAGSIGLAVRKAMELNTHVPIEIEVETLDELTQALDAGADRIMLDNFDLDMMRKAVTLNAGRAKLEVSGNVSLEKIKAIAATGVDYVSVGALTKNVKAIDLSMRITLRK
ncbi:MAG: carboxylating nicotinate-nucleotide diphosphorylase [Candidatus Methylumidiphilus alinenensis]|uniref:Probable nicotinate-nucleotide pyrophosphorylase [carboxylating] n=1 Tax=Candidatus Methylumidiphilus alinenensis TaxID=2202197 RepID=A0A2W4SC40_9GAMM|nr:MAG: carboxylating nicotinate-nucleotide diphosphorylase [Candidatus Methylumidiphilus alinenensis]